MLRMLKHENIVQLKEAFKRYSEKKTNTNFLGKEDFT